MRINVETLLFDLNCFLWENPDWSKADVVMEATQGGRIFARRPIHGKGFDITWEEKDIYVCPTRRPEDSI